MREHILEVKKLIPEKYCKKIISYFDYNYVDAQTTGLGLSKDVRNCKTRNVMRPETFGERICSNFIQTKLLECVGYYKDKYSHFYADKISSCELLKYQHNKYKTGYQYHVDMGHKVSDRHASISICLNNDFLGGEFKFDLPEGEIQMPQNVGDAIIFPSNFMFPHQVNQITKGTRYALVAWVI